MPYLLAVVVLFASLAPAFSQEPAAKKTPPTPQQISKAIENLGHTRFVVREQATKALSEMGHYAEPALREATKSTDEEVSSRAKAIVEKFDWGIYPDTPAEILKLITTYQGGDASVRVDAIKSLLRIKPLQMATLRKLLAQEKDVEARYEIYADLGLQLRQILPHMILRDELDEAQELLEICIASPYGRYDFTTFVSLRGQLEPTLKKYEKLFAESTGDEAKKHAETLMHLARLKKDWPAARRYALATENPEFPDMIAWESSDWKALAEDKNQNRERDFRAAQATFYRMAGDKTKFNELLDEMRKEITGIESSDETAMELAKALLLNGKGGEAVKLLRDRTKGGTDMVFDLLCAQLKYREAFAYADKALKEKAEEGDEEDRGYTKTMLNLRRARTLALLGDKDSAIQLFRKISDEAIDGQQVQVLAEAAGMLKRLGEEDLVLELVFKVANAPGAQRDEVLYLLIDTIYDSQSSFLLCWLFATKNKKDGLEVLRSILKGKTDRAVLDNLVLAMEKDTRPLPANRLYPMPLELDKNGGANLSVKRSRIEAIAEAYLRCGHKTKAEEYFKKLVSEEKFYSTVEGAFNAINPSKHTPSPHSYAFGLFLMNEKRYSEAGKQFQLVWESNPAKPLPLFLQGESLIKAGQVEEGKKLQEKAHWVAMGDESTRFKFSEELNKRGFSEASQREMKFIVETAWFHSYEVGNAYLRHARHLARERKFNEAADLFEKDVVSLFRTGATFMDGSAYLHVPEQARTYRVKALFNAGKRDEAFALAREGMEAMPGNVDLVIGFVPELDRAGRKQEADEFYSRLKKTYEAAIKDYPNSPELRNSLAWTMVNCNRDLPEARQHAEKAVSLAPKMASYLDTLAEIRFRQRDRAAALEMMKRCTTLAPTNPYYRKQLERFEKKPFDSPLPDEETGDE